MGCDIHIVLERRVKNKWVGVDPFSGTSYDNTGDPAQRHYVRFAALAGVRGDGPEPKGIPDDASELSQLLIEDWGINGHSHSWLSLKEACKIYNTARYSQENKIENYQAEYPASYWFRVDDDNIDNYRIVFWFDN